MKKIFFAASVASALSLVNIAQAATNGTITFEGKVVDQTCQVGINGGTNASATVKLGGVAKSALDAANKVAGYTPFTFNLTGCKAQAAVWGVTAYFPDNATYIDSSKQLLKNVLTGAGAATNVGLELLTVHGAKKTTVPLGKPASAYFDAEGLLYYMQAATNVTPVLTYAVQYKATGVATEGQVKGTAIYELSYN